jgi:hypothetical protein
MGDFILGPLLGKGAFGKARDTLRPVAVQADVLAVQMWQG